MTRIAPVSSRLLNSIQRCTRVLPVLPPATMLCAVQAGQSGQPSPDWLSRTAAPVMMMPAEAATPASAMRRIDTADGASTGAASMRAVRARDARGGGPAAALPEAESVSTDPSLAAARDRPTAAVRPAEPAPIRRRRGTLAGAGRHHAAHRRPLPGRQ